MQNLIRRSTTVKQLLDTQPGTIPVFFALKMLCVGCPLKKFCTLEEAAAAYQIPPDQFLEKLANPHPSNRGALHEII